MRGFIILATALCLGCSEDSVVYLRIQNTSAAGFRSVNAVGVEFGAVPSAGASKYRKVGDHVYGRTIEMGVVADGRKSSAGRILLDLVGEHTLEAGYYTAFVDANAPALGVTVTKD